MTADQKEIVVRLLAGGSIAYNRLRDSNHNPVKKVHPRTFDWLKKTILKRLPSGVFVVSKKKIWKLHGNSWIKRTHKQTFI